MELIFIGHCESSLQTVTNQLNRSWEEKKYPYFNVYVYIFLVRQGAVLMCIIRV